MKVKNGNCDHCGKANKECAVFTKRVWFVFKTDVVICQSCVSKAFRSFRKGK